ncbi:hypothetical protein QUF74_12405 [Candidatus Halobeggiatoa sp. HSG11]|nr:hypothetical protein [Candidatus Halobeggiatoa sp. HSG11]
MKFTTEEIAILSAQMDEQLRELRDQEKHLQFGASKSASPIDNEEQILEKQRQQIAENTQEAPDTFLHKYGSQAKDALCKESSELSKQWQKWGDLRNEDVLEKLGSVLLIMGYSGAALHILTVAISVYVIRVGLNAFCEKYC